MSDDTQVKQQVEPAAVEPEPTKGELPAEIQAHVAVVEKKLTALVLGYDQETGAFNG